MLPGRDPGRRGRVGRSEGRSLAETAERLRDAGLRVEEVSVGSTPDRPPRDVGPGVTECRPGNYVFHDASQVAWASAPRRTAR